MLKKSLFLVLTLFLLLPLVTNRNVRSDDTIEQIQNKINEYTQKINELGKAKNTLSNQIDYLNSQIQLTILKIDQTKNSISVLQNQIADLTTKISDMDTTLNQLTSVYLEQIVANYKLQKKIPAIALFIGGNFNSLFEQYKYISSIQKNSQNTLVSLETVRTNYDIQKEAKRQKQQELQDLQKSLNVQNSNLAKQKQAKDNLLAATKNDEKKYQQLLADALKQLSQLKNFSKSGGSVCLSSVPGTGSDGWFFSQRDPRWCNQYIGLSHEDTVGEVGCFISSISMIWKKYGFDMTPSIYAANPNYFLGTTAWMSNPDAPPGYTYSAVSGYNQKVLDNELKNGRPVIVQLSMKSIAGMHFIVIKSGSNGNYTMNDPWFGADLDFSSHYSTSAIMSLRLITKS